MLKPVFKSIEDDEKACHTEGRKAQRDFESSMKRIEKAEVDCKHLWRTTGNSLIYAEDDLVIRRIDLTRLSMTRLKL